MSNVFRVVFSLIYNLTTSKLSKILKLHEVWSSGGGRSLFLLDINTTAVMQMKT